MLKEELIQVHEILAICCLDLPASDNERDRGSYMSAHVLLNLLNELGKRDKMRGLPSILSLFRNEFKRLAEHFISFSQRV